MGLCNSPDIVQEKMNILMDGLEFVRADLDDLLVLTKGSWEDHLEKLEEVLSRIKEAGLKVNANKSFFGEDSLEYLGYSITRNGIQPLPKKLQAIQNIAPLRIKSNSNHSSASLITTKICGLEDLTYSIHWLH